MIRPKDGAQGVQLELEEATGYRSAADPPELELEGAQEEELRDPVATCDRLLERSRRVEAGLLEALELCRRIRQELEEGPQ